MATIQNIPGDEALATSRPKINLNFAALNEELALKATTSALTAHAASTSNPHSVTKSQVGLSNVDNTSDAAKPISTATQAALDGKQAAGSYAAASHSHTSASVTDFQEAVEDLVGGSIIAGSNVSVSYNDATGKTTVSATISGGGGGDLVSTNNLSDVANASTARTNLGLGSVDNTADTAKPVSTAQAAADAAVQAAAVQRSNHTGTQAISTITSLQASLDAKAPLKRVVALTDAATVTPNADTTDLGTLATLSQTTTIANPTGTPVNGQELSLRIKSSSARTLSFGNLFRGGNDLALPTTTTGGSKTDYFKFAYNSTDTKWDIVGKTTGY